MTFRPQLLRGVTCGLWRESSGTRSVRKGLFSNIR